MPRKKKYHNKTKGRTTLREYHIDSCRPLLITGWFTAKQVDSWLQLYGSDRRTPTVRELAGCLSKDKRISVRKIGSLNHYRWFE